MRGVCFVLLIGVLLALVPGAQAQEQSDLLGRINNLRSSLGLAPYSLNGALSRAANSHARWMVETGQVSHTQPDGSNPRSRAAAAGYPSQWVSENIYGGTGATVDVAWNFWVNSSIHYRGLTNPNYQDVGIGIARGEWGAAYVLVFGTMNNEWQAANVNTAANNSTNEGGQAAAPPPSFVVGVDAFGNIMHEIQPGDTLGDIALLYGYSWDDIPYMMTLNELDDTSVRELKVGAVFLVPPSSGTYTPTPAPATETGTPTPEPSATASDTPTPTHTATPRILPVTAGAEENTVTPVASATATALAVAEAEADPPPVQRVTTTSGRSPWLFVAIGVQVVLIIGAGVELVLRQMRR